VADEPVSIAHRGNQGAEVVTSYTRWLECVQARGVENQDVYLTFSPNFERIWLEAKKRLPEYVSQKLANLGLRSQDSAVRLGEKARHVWNEAHFAGAAPKIARAGIGERCRRKDHPGGSIASLSEFSAKSIGYCDRGDHQEDGHKHRNRVACAIKISRGNVGDFFD
jgi:hypothetical protein